MNWIGLATVFLAFPAFAAGCRNASTSSTTSRVVLGWTTGIVLAIPAALYLFYYARLFGEPMWFYQWRAIPGTELFAFPSGFLAGWLHVRLIPRLRLSRWGKQLMVPVLLAFGVAIPYLKPLVQPRPLRSNRAQWVDGVCLQSTYSTCGPASAVTVLHELGIEVSEKELADVAFTSGSGTENWYLARAIRQHGVTASFVFSKSLDAPLPAIVGVRLKESGNTGHFIALLEKRGNSLVFGDPMRGRFTNTLAELDHQYEFTGFMLSVRRVDDHRGH